MNVLGIVGGAGGFDDGEHQIRCDEQVVAILWYLVDAERDETDVHTVNLQHYNT